MHESQARLLVFSLPFLSHTCHVLEIGLESCPSRQGSCWCGTGPHVRIVISGFCLFALLLTARGWLCVGWSALADFCLWLDGWALTFLDLTPFHLACSHPESVCCLLLTGCCCCCPCNRVFKARIQRFRGECVCWFPFACPCPPRATTCSGVACGLGTRTRTRGIRCCWVCATTTDRKSVV